MTFLRTLRALLWALLLAWAAAGLVIGLLPRGTELPWAPLDLSRPIGPATATRIAALRDHPAHCRALLEQAGIAFRRLEAASHGACPLPDAVTWAPGGTRDIAYRPVRPPLSCSLAAALALWERQVVQPEAERLLGTPVVAMDHFGTYACRRLYGRAAGPWSEHARAAAIDVAGFRLGDGRRITVARDWRGAGPEARFLHAVRDGACSAFTTTLSPDYNAAHRDHLHLDEANRSGWRACR